MQATVMEPDVAGFESLKSQLLERRQTVERIPEAKLDAADLDATPAETETKVENTNNQTPESKKFTFRKGDQTFDLDEDAELEMMADKVPMKLTLKELKDRAAGDIAVKNRMHQLAEEKKKVQSTLRDFTKLAKENPLKALEYISNKAKEADSSFEYDSYLKALADQAETLSNMSEPERQNKKLEEKLKETERDLSQAKQVQNIRDRGALIMEETGIGESQFGELVQQVLASDNLMDGIENETQLMDVVQSFAHEVRAQQYVYQITKAVDKDLANDSQFLFYMSDVVQNNPEFDESDIRDMITDYLTPEKKKQAEMRLSSKQRGSPSNSPSQVKVQNMTDYELLVHQLQERKNSNR